MRGSILAALAACLLAPGSAAAIVNGEPASEAYPWMAAVTADGEQFCGGSLIRPDWVLTAAHCPEGEDFSKLAVVLGRHKLSAGGGEEIAVDRVVIHEGFDGQGSHDVALLHLARPSSQPTLRVLEPPEASLWAPGVPARVIGWGMSGFVVGTSSDDLEEVDVPMVSDADCATSYNAGGLDSQFDPQTMVCAGERTGLKGPCQGDSGGPLLVKDAAGAWAQAGTVSFGTGCGYPMFYGVFGRVGAPSLHGWIEAHLPPLAAPAAPTGPVPAPPPAPAVPAPATGAAPVRLSVSRALGSARKAKRAKAITLRVASTARVTGLTAELVRGGRAVAAGRLAVLDGRGAVRLRVRRALRPGAYRVRLRAADAAGRAVQLALRARLRR